MSVYVSHGIEVPSLKMAFTEKSQQSPDGAFLPSCMKEYYSFMHKLF